MENKFVPSVRRSNEDIPQETYEGQQLNEIQSQGMRQTDASIRPGQFEMLTPSGAAFRPMEASSRNASSMPGAGTRPPREDVGAPFEASFQQSINATERSIFASQEESVHQKNAKQGSFQSYQPLEMNQ